MISLFAFAGTSVRHINSIFTSEVRWLLIGLLALYLLSKRVGIRSTNSSVFLCLFVYLIWCVATTLWSEIPVLSGSKSIALVFVSITFIQAGILFVNKNGIKNALFFCVPFVGLSLFAGGMGGNSVTFNDGTSNQINLYQGLTGNPNMFGFICAMGIPFLIWKIQSARLLGKKYLMYLILFVIIYLFLLSSNSRASIGISILVFIGLAYGLGANTTVASGVALVCTYIFIFLAFPSVLDVIEHRFIYKGQNSEAGILFSRENEWNTSMDYAKAGGVVGAGYGVTVGYGGFSFGLDAVGYGREKANSQLGILEETGLIGFFLYIVLLLAIFTRLIMSMRRLRRSDKRVALGICLGLLLGLTFHSFFEAWWGAPGSAEAAYFWAVVGIALGISEDVRTTPM